MSIDEKREYYFELITGDRIHPEIMLEDIKALYGENARLKSEVERLSRENSNLRIESERLCERYRLIERANAEWTRNDAVTFGGLYEEQARLKDMVESCRTLLSEAIHLIRNANGSKDWITEAKQFEQEARAALSEEK